MAARSTAATDARLNARLMEAGESRLAAARASEDHTVREALDVGRFDEDDLYRALEYLQEHQSQIEAALAPPPCGRGAGAVFLYDVTNVYFEGEHNALAKFGYNRDGKQGKRQLVAGLLTDGEGEPLSIQLYRGNPNDPPTFLEAVEKLKVRFGAEAVALVGDRGMIKALGKQALGEAKFRYVTALTQRQVRAMLKAGKLQMELFDGRSGTSTFRVKSVPMAVRAAIGLASALVAGAAGGGIFIHGNCIRSRGFYRSAAATAVQRGTLERTGAEVGAGIH